MKKTPLLIICVFISLFLSFILPLIGKKNTENPYVFHEKLSPFYHQNDIDALNGLHTAAGFPDIYKTLSYRINRPLLFAFSYVSGKVLIKPLLGFFIPEKYKIIKWGHYSALTILSVYSSYLFLNIIFTIITALLLFRLTSFYFDKNYAFVSVLFFFLSPVTIFGTRGLYFIALDNLIYVLSFYIISKTCHQNSSLKKIALYSIILGFLFTGKFNPGIIAAGFPFIIFQRGVKTAALVFFCVFSPYVLWTTGIKIFGFGLYIQELERAGKMGFIDTFNLGSLYDFLMSFLVYIKQWFQSVFFNTGFIQIGLLIFGLYLMIRDGKLKYIYILEYFTLILTVYFYLIFCVKSQPINPSYSMSLFILFYPVMSIGIADFGKTITTKLFNNPQYQNMVTAVVFILSQSAVLFRSLPKIM